MNVTLASTGLVILLSAGLLQAVPASAQAQGPVAAPAFTNLPGVKPEDPLGSGDRITCEQILVDRAQAGIVPDRGPRYNTLNACSRNGGPTVVSPKTPPSIYRQLRGFTY